MLKSVDSSAVSMASDVVAKAETRRVWVPPTYGQPPKQDRSRTKKQKSNGNKEHQRFLDGVNNLVQSVHDEKVIVSGVILRTEVDVNRNRWYHLESAPPGSLIAVANEANAKISERQLLNDNPPSEKIVGFTGCLLYDHLRINDIVEALKEHLQPS